MASVKVGAIQLSSTARVVQNLTKARELIRQAAEEGAQILALPENFSFMGREEEKGNLLGPIESETISFLEDVSREFQIYLLGGGFATSGTSGKGRNTALWIDPSGKHVLEYYKLHLFDQVVGDGVSYQESKNTEPGSDFPRIVPILGFHASTAICYDLRFPELFRFLSHNTCDLCFLPAAFTVPTGKAHWEVLLRARAIENLMYMVAPTQWGSHDPQGHRQTYGHSMIVSPWGEILAEKKEGEGFLLAEISPESVQETREKFPALKHRLFF